MEVLHDFLLVLCLSTATVKAYNATSLNTRIITNWRARPDTVYETQTDVPLMIFCIVKCASNPNCTAIDHFEDTCLYFTGDQLFVEDSTATGHTLVYVRDMFVLNAAKTYALHSLTFSEARQACGSLGGRLANYTELEMLFDRGFEHCACGFIDTGATVMIMQVAHIDCGNHVGLYMCGISMATAWCYIYPL